MITIYWTDCPMIMNSYWTKCKMKHIENKNTFGSNYKTTNICRILPKITTYSLHRTKMVEKNTVPGQFFFSATLAMTILRLERPSRGKAMTSYDCL